MVGQLSTAVLLATLRVTTSTPDALCPAPRAAEEAIAARLGEVREEGLVAEYRVVRGGESGDLLLLDLRDASGRILLHRELPLDQLSCGDAATALALQLESYFSALAAASESEPISDSESTAGAGAEESPRGAAPPPSSLPPESEEENPNAQLIQETSNPGLRWGISVSVGVAALASPLLGAGFVLRPGPALEFELWGDFPVQRTSFSESAPDGQEVTGSTYAAWSGLSARYLWHGANWSLGTGPSVVVLLQRARFLEVSDFRAVFGFGGELVGRYRLTRRLSIDAGFRAGPLVSGLTRTWKVIVSGGERELLPPPGFFLGGWLGVSFWPG
jgi:hypothetical protein